MRNEPLRLPRGSVRAILTILLVLISGAMLFVPIAAGAGDFRSMFLLFTGLALKDYFDSRKKAEEAEGPVLPDPVVND